MDAVNELLDALSPGDIEAIKSLAGNLLGGEGDSGSTAPALENLDLSALTAMLKPPHDDRTALIHALKPLLGEERRRRADEAIRLLQLAAMLPALQQSGILEKLLGGENGLL